LTPTTDRSSNKREKFRPLGEAKKKERKGGTGNTETIRQETPGLHLSKKILRTRKIKGGKPTWGRKVGDQGI